jgi:dTDP-4-dehydrorhamnose 3,5-epimerase
MIFTETILEGAFVIEPEFVKDERGMFARTWCQREFEAHGLAGAWVQASISVNRRKGTMRGMHYQVAPHEEVKLVRCTMGAIYDVIVDLRPESPTYCRHVGAMLSAENRRMLYIPERFAHGFLTLEDNSEVSYHMSEFYAPASARGFRWEDATFRIEWPEPVTVISEKDRTWPPFLTKDYA